MTVYPLIFHLGPIEITGYGLMMMVGFLVGGWTIQQQLKERNLNEEYAADMIVAAIIGGIIGAKLWFVGLTGNPAALFSRGGLVWYGGFLGGVAGVVINSLRKRVPIRLTADLAGPAVAVGYVMGRVGCFMVQDDYGVPSSLPWAMRFPEGLPPSTAASMNANFGVAIPAGVLPSDVLTVHPTQLYEVIIMTVVFGVLWRLRRHTHGTGWLFGLYLTLAGAERFLVEFFRAKDDRFFEIFTLAQATSIGLILIGLTVMTKMKTAGPVEIPPQAAVHPVASS